MSDSDPNWPQFLKSLEDDSASASAPAPPPSAAPVAAPQGVRLPTSDEALRSLKGYISEYLVELELTDLASLFREEAERHACIPPVRFVKMWVQLESQMIPCSAPQCEKLAAMLALNKGVEKYLEHLELDARSFKERAWRHAVRRIPLIKIWMDRIYPQIDAGYPGRDGII